MCKSCLFLTAICLLFSCGKNSNTDKKIEAKFTKDRAKAAYRDMYEDQRKFWKNYPGMSEIAADVDAVDESPSFLDVEVPSECHFQMSKLEEVQEIYLLFRLRGETLLSTEDKKLHEKLGISPEVSVQEDIVFQFEISWEEVQGIRFNLQDILEKQELGMFSLVEMKYARRKNPLEASNAVTRGLKHLPEGLSGSEVKKVREWEKDIQNSQLAIEHGINFFFLKKKIESKYYIMYFQVGGSLTFGKTLLDCTSVEI